MKIRLPLRKFKLKKVAMFLALITSFSLSAQTIQFDSLRTEANIQQKEILLYFSGSDWCGPCIRFKRDFISTPNFSAFAEDNLLLYNVDFPRKRANQPSKAIVKNNEVLADKYNPRGTFPLILLLDAEGKILKKWEYLPQESLEEFIENLSI